MERVLTPKSTTSNLIWFLVVFSLLLSVVGLGIAVRPVSIPKPPVNPPEGVSGVAELAVITHLVNAVGTSEHRVPVAHTIRIDPAGQDRWAAQVAVHDPVALRIWQVRVHTDQGIPQTVGLPALVPSPTVLPKDTPTFLRTPSDSKLYQTVEASLSALLTGNPDLSRYTSADSTMTPISPPPFVGVDVIGLTKPIVLGQDHIVLVEVEGRRADGVVIRAQYPLALTTQGNEWEVRGILRDLPDHSVPASEPQEGGTSDD
ncbi:conjugal transfer protein [Stomatohabitans albus]|uniref:conjugal transfer protein n=1 Tax=Stomatohabitans albus TaxID=3110766 RepID=UPI00300D2A84